MKYALTVDNIHAIMLEISLLTVEVVIVYLPALGWSFRLLCVLIFSQK
jgi:hypothetical protein